MEIGMEVVQAKSNQLNAADLLVKTKFKIIRVNYLPRDKAQPIHIHLEGCEGRPYKPSKGMRKPLMDRWGRNTEDWLDQCLELYCNDSITFGDQQTGGIQISAMTGIDKAHTFSLRKSRTKYELFTIQPIKVKQEKFVKEDWVKQINGSKTVEQISLIVKEAKSKLSSIDLNSLKETVINARSNLATS